MFSKKLSILSRFSNSLAQSVLIYGLCNDVSLFSILMAEVGRTKMDFQAMEQHEQNPSTAIQSAAGPPPPSVCGDLRHMPQGYRGTQYQVLLILDRHLWAEAAAISLDGSIWGPRDSLKSNLSYAVA